MAFRRSCRSKRTVDYAKVENSNGSDDDFETATPPTKRTKKVKHQDAEHQLVKESQKPSKHRLADRQNMKFEEDLDRALKLSLTSSQVSCGNVSDLVSSRNPKKEKSKENVDPCPRTLKVVCQADDNITVVKENSPRNRSESSIDDDYTASPVPSNEDEEESVDKEDSDSDFDDQLEKAKAKKAPAKRKAPKSVSKKALRTAPLFPPPVPEPVKCPLKPARTKANVSQSRAIVTSPHRHPPLSAPGLKQPSWNPPGAAGTNSSLKAQMSSPATLRIGLSRNARLKPLHASQHTK